VGLLERDHVRLLGRRLGLRRALHRGARELGYDLVKRHYYSEVPDLDSLPAGIWSARSELSGIDFDVAAGLRFVREELGAAMAEFDAPQHSRGDPAEFYFQNTFYEGLDAETLYAMVRRYRPRRVLELGSGMSTLVIARARECNGLRPGDRHDVFDPFSRPELRDALRSACELHPVSATEVPAAAFAQLAAGDLLFVDTTHTVKIGSDVNRVILDVLPRLAPGVLVHFHDIYLPYEYPIEFYTELGFSWAEQYLLQAFLALNPEFEILFGNAALAREHPAEIAAALPSAAESTRPSAFWIRRRERAPD
jgi:hypothetical protein